MASKRAPPSPRLGGIAKSGTSEPHEAVAQATAAAGLVREAATEGRGNDRAKPAAGPQLKVEAASQLSELFPGAVVSIALHLIGDNKFNARYFYLSEDIGVLADSMRRNSQLAIATGWVEGDQIILTDGHTRARAAQVAGLTYLQVDIVPRPNLRAGYLASWTMNRKRSTHTALDDAVRWQQLLSHEVFADQTELAAALGVSAATVSRTLAINQLPMWLLQRMRESPRTSSLRAAFEIARFFAASKQTRAAFPIRGASNEARDADTLTERLIEDTIVQGISSHALHDIVNRRLAAPKRRYRSDAREVRVNGINGKLKTSKDRSSLDLVFRGLTPDQCNQVATTIETALATGLLAHGAGAG